jgi:hypothetical protein
LGLLPLDLFIPAARIVAVSMLLWWLVRHHWPHSDDVARE